jgi:hypothetical protein
MGRLEIFHNFSLLVEIEGYFSHEFIAYIYETQDWYTWDSKFALRKKVSNGLIINSAWAVPLSKHDIIFYVITQVYTLDNSGEIRPSFGTHKVISKSARCAIAHHTALKSSMSL